MSDNLMDDMVMDLDLNQEPLDPSSGSPLVLGSLLTDLETAHSRIEERIRKLEAVTARALQRHRWRQARSSTDTGNVSVDGAVNVDSEMQGQNRVSNLDTGERTIGCKRDSSHLVAKALEMDLLVNKLPYVDSTTKECPVCKGEVADANVTPIYEALRRIRTFIGLQQDSGGVNLSFASNSNVLQTADTLSSRRLRSRLFSRVLSEGAASLSSELDNAQWMFEDLAASLTDRLLQRSTNADVLPAVHGTTGDGDSLRRDAALIQSNYRTLDAVAGTGSTSSVPSSSQANEVSETAVQLENLRTDTGNLPAIRSSLASRRRSLLSRLSVVDFRESRRRRLN
ncbi:hypothetical protein RND71_007604 [Anisodus tanguticus]|uniref:Uncharacterized protein n=1 Tax=Anisodus tanguticus TaxID=243964 RepID=A0AAE1VTP4_9SOLA|nr:hypothetical protein RND71_007604 [Anisodus tanguticus]